MLLLTVATDNTDGFRRYLRSAEVNGLVGKVVGMGEEWRGGDMAGGPGGGHKINLLRKEVEDIIKEEEKRRGQKMRKRIRACIFISLKPDGK